MGYGFYWNDLAKTYKARPHGKSVETIKAKIKEFDIPKLERQHDISHNALKSSNTGVSQLLPVRKHEGGMQKVG